MLIMYEQIIFGDAQAIDLANDMKLCTELGLVTDDETRLVIERVKEIDRDLKNISMKMNEMRGMLNLLEAQKLSIKNSFSDRILGLRNQITAEIQARTKKDPTDEEIANEMKKRCNPDKVE